MIPFAKPIAAACLLTATLAPLAARADHWRQTADPQLVIMLEQVIYTYQSYCNMGNPSACQMVPMVQQGGMQMLNASYDCVAYNHPGACQFYQGSANQLQQMYMQLNQYAQMPMDGGGMGMGNPLGETHMDRMNAIDQWGQQNTQNFNDRMQQMDQSHQQFMQTLQ